MPRFADIDGTTNYSNSSAPFTSLPVTAPKTAPLGGDTTSSIPNFGSFNTASYGGPYSPTFNTPQFPNFNAPNANDLFADPSYQFRFSQGQGALENSAASKGLLHTGGTFKDLINYGQNFASQEYGNVFSRAMQEYQPKVQEWQTLTGLEQSRGLASFQRYWDVYALGVEAQLKREAMLQGLILSPGPGTTTTPVTGGV